MTQDCRVPGLPSEPALRLHHHLLQAFAATGQPPARAELEQLARASAAEVDAIVAELTGRDLIALDAAGEVRAAYPFSPKPTPIRVSWAGGPTVYAMCAIDALGISAMLSRPVTITAEEPGTGRAVTVAVDGATAHWDPDSAVVYAGVATGATGPSADRTCSYINFFSTKRAAQVWAAAHPELTGKILTQADALKTGIDEFGPLLRGAQ